MSEAISVGETTNLNDLRWGMLQRKLQETNVLRAFALFRDHDIEPILIKGLAAARYYPETVPRLSIDIDFAFSGIDFEAAKHISTSAAADGLAIDFHNELRHLDTVAWSDLYENSELIEIDGGTIRVLRPEDHLRVLCVHWLNDGGYNKERLWDIYYLIYSREADFDWDRFLGTVSERRQRWLICTLGLAHKYLGLSLENTPVRESSLDLPAWLINTVEREWASDTKALPLETVIYDRKKLWQQILRRINSNPIRDTIEMEGSFDARTRLFYRVVGAFKRILPSYRRVSATIKGKRR